jgi:acyl dehydratase
MDWRLFMKEKIRHNISTCFTLFLFVSSLVLMAAGCGKVSETPAVKTAEEPTQTVDTSKFLTLYPGVYTEKEKPLIQKYFADNKAIEDRGTINLKALINGSLPKDTLGLGPTLKITETMVRYFNRLRDPENPLLNDAEYARKAGFKDILAYPTISSHDDTFMIPYPVKARDTLLVADLIHSVTNYKPVYPGDTLYLVANSRHLTDLTPDTGSVYRSSALVNKGSVYNQRAEKVLDVIYTVEENTKLYKEGLAPANPTFNDMWEEFGRGTGGSRGGGASGERGGGREGAPGGGGTYYYTDADWQIIKDIWSKEKHRGAEPLYWEDVKIGDQPTPTLEGPVDSAPQVAVPWGMGLGGNRTLKKDIMDPEIFKTLVRDETDGIYRPANQDDYILPVPLEAQTGGKFGDMGAVDAVLGASQQGGRGTAAPGGPDAAAGGAAPGGGRGGGVGMMNFAQRDYAIRHLSDWMGDKGWLYNIRWGGLFSADMAKRGDPHPAVNPHAKDFLEFDRLPEEVKNAKVYPSPGGGSKFILIRSYVYDKYVRDGEFFIDLIWWQERIGSSGTGMMGCATIKLPSRKAS